VIILLLLLLDTKNLSNCVYLLFLHWVREMRDKKLVSRGAGESVYVIAATKALIRKKGNYFTTAWP
jgi:hypothetical protein